MQYHKSVTLPPYLRDVIYEQPLSPLEELFTNDFTQFGEVFLSFVTLNLKGLSKAGNFM